jgi:hypothetical protein
VVVRPGEKAALAAWHQYCKSVSAFAVTDEFIDKKTSPEGERRKGIPVQTLPIWGHLSAGYEPWGEHGIRTDE